MGIRRQSTCSYCYGRGHTRRACPTMRERATEAAKKPANERDWLDQRAIERVADYKASSSAPRSCAYCSESGHNAKGCATRKNDIINAISNTITFRKKFLQALKDNNFGVGAIVSYNGYFSGIGYSRDNGAGHYLLVKGFVQHNIVPWNCYNKRSKLEDSITVQHITNLSGDYRSSCNVGAPPPVISSIDPTYNPDYSRVKIISGCSSETGMDETKFLSWQICEEIVKEVFNSKIRNKVVSRAYLQVNNIVLD